MVLRFFILAITFFFLSCGDIERDNPNDPGSDKYRGYQILQPPSGESSSSSGSIISNVIYGDPVSYKGETYETVVIGTQTWFKRNLNYDVEGSKCYGEGGEVYNPETDEFDIILSNSKIQANCNNYGRLYDWATAMALHFSCNSSTCSNQVQLKHRGICPSGWHIPSEADLDALMTAVGEQKTAGRKLKAADGWRYCGTINSDKNYNYVCEDAFGFSALPGGLGYFNDSDGGFIDVGNGGYWWSANEYNSSSTYFWGMSCDYEGVWWSADDKSFLFSVRCVKD